MLLLTSCQFNLMLHFVLQHLAADKAYQNLDIPVKKALEYRAHSERIIKCTLNDTLHAVLEKIVQAEVCLSFSNEKTWH